jgi:S-adenosylmethionine:tRNA ribosyltransferase-isomerase
MRIEEFDYCLPEELIAQYPAEQRDMSRLMVIDRNRGALDHKHFKDLIEYIEPGDCLVFNDTRVIPARLYGRKQISGGKIEFVLLSRIENDVWEVMLKPGKRAKKGSVFVFGDNELTAEVIDIVEGGNRIVRFEYEGVFENVLHSVGIIPLPPYIKKTPPDISRYQTVYSKNDGSAAAPTAGLHFTLEMLELLRKKGATFAFITLHVGIGTFRPVKTKTIEEHKMHSEFFRIEQEACEKINNARGHGKKIIAVGTTSCRVLESVANENSEMKPVTGWTDIFIYPGYEFKAVNAMITNFHLPRSTLLMLVSAFSEKKHILNAYRQAVNMKYRFFSFGDAMLII